MTKLRIPVDARDHVRGPANAAITLVEYGDYECPFCRAAFWVLENLEARNRDLRLVYRHFPLSEMHPYALLAAEAAEAADAQGEFWDMHRMLYRHAPRLEPEDLLDYAEQIAIDVDQVSEDLSTHRHRERIREDFVGGVRSGVNGTPCIFINDQRYDGPIELLGDAIADERRRQMFAH